MAAGDLILVSSPQHGQLRAWALPGTTLARHVDPAPREHSSERSHARRCLELRQAIHNAHPEDNLPQHDLSAHSSLPVSEIEFGWIQRAQAGDRDAFGKIMLHHQAAALRLATVICGDSTEAFDIVQEAFLKIHRGLGTLRSTESLRPWIMRVVANEAKNSQRGRWRRERRANREIALRDEVLAETEATGLSNVEAHSLLQAIGRLPDRDRRVIACRYFAQMSESETAAALEVAAGTVKSQTARALARLRAEIGD